MILRLGIAIFLYCTTTLMAVGDQTNYVCVVCGKGPLTGRIWLHPRGAICDDCYQLPDHCSICGLPVRPGDGHIKTADGRMICRFDKPNVILTQDQARDLFEQVRSEVVDLYGRQFVLRYSTVTVSLFDVDYWSEKGTSSGLHKFGFASTRYAAGRECTHEVVMLSGRTRQEMTAVAAHEYTHLWINENCGPNHQIDGDTIEAICELTAYKLMQARKDPEMQRQILNNPYTRGKIKDLIAVEREGGTDYVLNWVKSSTATTFDVNANLAPLPTPAPVVALPAGPRVLPTGLKFSGTMSFGREPLAVINGEEFAPGDEKNLKLRDQIALIHCREIHDDQVTVEVRGKTLVLPRGQETALP